MKKSNKDNQKNRLTRGIAAVSLAAIAAMGLTGCKEDEPMVLYGMPDDLMIQEELDKAASESTSEPGADETATSETGMDETSTSEETSERHQQ